MLRYLFILLIFFAASTLVGQPVNLNPILVHEGFAEARQAAIDILADDAVPVFIGAVGRSMFDNGGTEVELRFYLEDGRSTAWAYSFYSPSLKRDTLVAAIDVPGLGIQAFPTESPVPIPSTAAPVDMTLPYAGSDKAIERLTLDSVYARYRSELPAMLPDGIALHMPDAADSTTVPSWFPLDRPVWVMTFSGEGSRAMTCYVAAGTGATYCVRATAASVREKEHEGKRMELAEEGIQN